MKKRDVRNQEAEADQPPAEVENPPEAAVGAVGLPAELSEEAVKRLEDELTELRDRHVRLAAEFDNFRKRVAKERVELTDRAQAALVVKLIDVLDDLDRVESGGQLSENDVVQQALILIEKKFRKELEAAGLERIDPVGDRFDPSVHEAVSVVAAPDAASDHKVSATFQSGYRYKGSLLRPARVQVFSSEGHV
ncbi:MAG TPA: nucleotide exchange factor GrpE [Gemmatimonadales bacterium]|jgi:molecular chaperone GrpE